MAKVDGRRGRDSLIPIARDVIKHAKEGTLRQAEEVMQLPAENYTDPDRFEAELNQVIKKEKPNIIFHLAAQSVVSESYINPISTMSTNVIGSANVLETVRINKITRY